MRSSAALLIVLLVLLLAPAGRPYAGAAQDRGARPDPAARWLAVEAPGFVLLTDLDRRHASLLADRLERLRTLLAEITPQAITSADDTRVFVLSSRAQYLRFAPRAGGRADEKVTGFFQTSIHGDRLVVDGSAEPLGIDDLPFETLFHEALHAWVRRNLPWAPLWLNEGLAEYYSTARIEGERAALGLAKPRHLEWLARERWMPLDDLVAVESTTALHHGHDRRGAFYAQAWGLAHHLLSAPDRRELLARYLVDLAGGAEPSAAFESAFDRTYLALEAELERYLSEPELPTLVVRAAIGSPLPAPRELGRVETLVRLGELAVRLGHLGDARSLLEEALRLDPRSGLAKAGLGEVADLEGDHGTAEVWFREAVESAPGEAIAHHLLGESTLRRLLRQQRDGVDWTSLDSQDLVAARAHLRRAVALDPGRGASHAALGQSWLIAEQGPPTWSLTEDGVREALGALGRAADLLPGEPQILLHLGLLLCRSGGCDRARALEPGLRRFRRPELLLRQEEQLATTELELAGWLVNHGELDRGQAIAERLDRTLPPGLRGQLGAAIDEVVRVARHNRAVHVVEEAVELARAGAVPEAIAVLDRLLAQRPEAAIERTARDLRRRLSSP